MRLSAPRWCKQPLDGSRARTSRPPAPRGDAREASSIQASPVPRCVVDLELVAPMALRRGSSWCWCPTRVYSRESECRRSCQAFEHQGVAFGISVARAISVDGCGSGGEFAQDCVDGDGAGHSVPAPRVGGSCGDDLFGAGGARRADRDDVAKHDPWVTITIMERDGIGSGRRRPNCGSTYGTAARDRDPWPDQ